MRKQSNSMLVLAFFMTFIATGLFFAGMTRTVDAAPPSLCNPCDEMNTINEKLDAIDEKVGLQGYPHAPVEKTGQTMSYATGDDGQLQKGVLWPKPRFTDNGNGTVTDNLTGLIWMKKANCDGIKDWGAALTFCNGLANGSCELSDGSSAGDWRLPNVRELHSLIDYGQVDPALPANHPFDDVQSFYYYWSATTNVSFIPASAWCVNMFGGYVDSHDKTVLRYVWCVRGGQ